MLAGDGADELFWGYPRMHDVLRKRHWFQIPFKIRRPLNRITNKIGISKTHAPYFFKTLDEFIFNKQLKIGGDRLDLIFPETKASNELERIYSGFKSKSKEELLQKLRRNEFKAHLQRVLIKVDRTSMHNSLEVRVPFLDQRCIDFSASIKPGLGIRHIEPKILLKNALADELPENLISKKKKGFSVPVDKWLRGVLRDDLKKTIFQTPIYGGEFWTLSL